MTEALAPPALQTGLHGHEAAERRFLAAWAEGRLHHGWLITGPAGVGKATLAFRIARALRAAPEPARAPDTLEVAPEHPAFRRIAAGAEPGLAVLSPAEGAAHIGIDEVRALTAFFTKTLPDGGWRVAIVDSADALTVPAANAALKLLEEPPARAVLLLVAHRPAALLATIRSRCRRLALAPLGPAAMERALAAAGLTAANPAALAELAGGSVGRAMAIEAAGGGALYADLVAILGGLPRLDRARMTALADSVAGREAEARFALLVDLVETLLARAARHGAGHPPAVEACAGEAALLARLSPDPPAARLWADIAASLPAEARASRALNLDAPALILDMLRRIEEQATRLPALQDGPPAR